jgi:Asp-tRNA(Asn)/Glu-tRNA(Gln) amidotransferase B subunit
MEPERTETDSNVVDYPTPLEKELREQVKTLANQVESLENANKRMLENERGLTLHKERLLTENRRYAEFFDSFAEIFKVSSAFIGVTDELRQEIEDNIDIEDRVKSIVSDNLSVEINDATINASLEVDI